MAAPPVRLLTARRGLLLLAGSTGLAALLLGNGLYLTAAGERLVSWLSAFAVVLFLVELLWAAAVVRPWRAFWTMRWPAVLLAFLLLAEVAALHLGWGGWLARPLRYLSVRSVTQAYLVVVQFYILGNLLVYLPSLYSRMARWRIRPGLMFLLAFVGLIVTGTGLLLLPRATPEGMSLQAVDALFTATSAVCVTGLIVRDTAAEFTRFGQMIILVLIQLGGLGIMSLAATFSWLLGRGVGIRESCMLRDVFQIGSLQAVARTLRFIVLLTFGAELIGAVFIYQGLREAVPSAPDRLFHAVFHAVSAFCNAGFSTFSDSLSGFSDNGVVVGSIAGLLIVGGLGFTVAASLVSYVRGRLARSGPGRRIRLDLQTRTVLILTLVLLVAGSALLAGLEWDRSFAGRPWAVKAGLAFFQSATARTAGFNTMDIASLSQASLFLLIVLMFVGAGPGSTAGGLKLTTVAVLWANLVATAKGRSQTRMGNRELSLESVRRAIVVLFGGLALGALGIFLLLMTERKDLLPTMFEAISAQGTVGLTLGLTPQLSQTGRLIVVLMMFLGRIGPLTLAYGLVPPARDRHIRLPRSPIMIG